jgi:DNA-binding Lrp family transcriptional regulator
MIRTTKLPEAKRRNRENQRIELLKLLQADCSQSNTKLATMLDIPLSSLIRLRAELERRRDVQSYKAVLNPRNFQLETLAFVRISLDDETKFRDTLKRLNSHPEIQEIHTIGEGFDFLVKVRVRSNEHLWRFLQEQLSTKNNIKRTESWIVMGTAKETTEIPLQCPELSKK